MTNIQSTCQKQPTKDGSANVKTGHRFGLLSCELLKIPKNRVNVVSFKDSLLHGPSTGVRWLYYSVQSHSKM